MEKNKLNPAVTDYINNANKWQEEMKLLRKIIVELGLNEVIKWGKPCYTFNNKNIVLIQGFKEYCALLFFKGYLMKDPKKVLVKTGINTRIGRQIRFTDIKQIIDIEDVIKEYIMEAAELFLC